MMTLLIADRAPVRVAAVTESLCLIRVAVVLLRAGILLGQEEAPQRISVRLVT